MKRGSIVLNMFQERLPNDDVSALHGVGLGRLISLRAEIGSSRAALGEEAGEDWLDEGTKDDLSATVVFW